MPLVNTSEIIKSAREHNTSVFAVNCVDFNTIYGCIRGAEATQTPVLVQYLPEHESLNRSMNIESFGAAVKKLASEVNVPIGLHLDHCYSFDEIRRAADAGFSSVMYDGSAFSLEENAEKTRAIVDEMHARGVWVEGEIGHVGLAAEAADADEDLYTKPDAAARFAAESGVDMLAIAIGNAHGYYKGTPHLDIARLDAIREATNGLPLVLHGGSGIPDDQLEVAFSRGINKFNYGTYFLAAYYAAIQKFIHESEGQVHPNVLDLCVPVQDALAEHMKDRYRLCKF